MQSGIYQDSKHQVSQIRALFRSIPKAHKTRRACWSILSSIHVIISLF